jgi:predicted transposase/invertase (TIGR01784 family)
MPRYLDPKNDLPFKRVFGEHPDLLKSFLNALMPLTEEQQIESLEYLPTEQVPDNPVKKNSIVDVRCRDKQGRQFIVEMQMLWTPSFAKRLLYYASKTYVRQLDRTENYSELSPVYALAILNDIFDKETPECYHHYQLFNRLNMDDAIRGIELVMVELPKFRPESFAHRRMAELWLRFLREVEEDATDISADLREDADICRAIDLCEEGAFTEAELSAYEDFWDVVRTEKTLLADGISEGEAKGEAKGRAEGLAEGEAKGRAEGLAEGLTGVVLNGKRSGFSLAQLQGLTGLSEEKILEILRLNGEA